MEVIKVTIEYDGEITVGGEYTAKGPITMDWFARNDLVLRVGDKTVTVNCDKVVAGKSYKIPAAIFGGHA